jgi:cellulose synthase (UDP-forming)
MILPIGKPFQALLLSLLGIVFSLELAGTTRYVIGHSVAFGAYDPHRTFRHAEVLIEHHFVPWRLNDTSELTHALAMVRANHRLPMITLEPWPWEWNSMTSETLFQDIFSGKYDDTIDQVLSVLQEASPQKILLRWGHEMEILGQYPWSKESSNDYIRAYRYIVDYARRKQVSNLVWVWSPAGNKAAVAYYPGSEYVDYVGISIYATREWNRDNSSQIPSFMSLLSEKYWVADSFNKPVIIAEVGVSGDDDARDRWLESAIQSLRRFPQVKAWIYFNQQQPPIVPLPIGLPDWELRPPQIQTLTQRWQQHNDRRLGASNIQQFIANR